MNVVELGIYLYIWRYLIRDMEDLGMSIFIGFKVLWKV